MRKDTYVAFALLMLCGFAYTRKVMNVEVVSVTLPDAIFTDSGKYVLPINERSNYHVWVAFDFFHSGIKSYFRGNHGHLASVKGLKVAGALLYAEKRIGKKVERGIEFPVQVRAADGECRVQYGAEPARTECPFYVIPQSIDPQKAGAYKMELVFSYVTKSGREKLRSRSIVNAAFEYGRFQRPYLGAVRTANNIADDQRQLSKINLDMIEANAQVRVHKLGEKFKYTAPSRSFQIEIEVIGKKDDPVEFSEKPAGLRVMSAELVDSKSRVVARKLRIVRNPVQQSDMRLQADGSSYRGAIVVALPAAAADHSPFDVKETHSLIIHLYNKATSKAFPLIVENFAVRFGSPEQYEIESAKEDVREELIKEGNDVIRAARQYAGANLWSAGQAVYKEGLEFLRSIHEWSVSSPVINQRVSTLTNALSQLRQQSGNVGDAMNAVTNQVASILQSIKRSN